MITKFDRGKRRLCLFPQSVKEALTETEFLMDGELDR